MAAVTATAPSREAIAPPSLKERLLGYTEQFPNLRWIALAGGVAISISAAGLFAFDRMTTPDEPTDPITEEVGETGDPNTAGLPLADSSLSSSFLSDADRGNADLPDPQTDPGVLRDASEAQTSTRREQPAQRQPTSPQRETGNQTPKEDTPTPSTPNGSNAGETKPEQQSTPETTPETQAETPPAEQPPLEQPKVNPAEMALQSTRALRNKLKDAIMTASWAGMPGPIAKFYQEKLKGLSNKFEIKNVSVAIDDGELRNNDGEVTLPITVHITYQQKGRDGQNSLPIPGGELQT
jgi:hypothetical protein